jgi:hypothetical protein
MDIPCFLLKPHSKAANSSCHCIVVADPIVFCAPVLVMFVLSSLAASYDGWYMSSLEQRIVLC